MRVVPISSEGVLGGYRLEPSGACETCGASVCGGFSRRPAGRTGP